MIEGVEVEVEGCENVLALVRLYCLGMRCSRWFGCMEDSWLMFVDLVLR